MNIYGRVGWRAAAAVNPFVTDADALAFVTAASITNPTQQSTINTLVTDLKGYGIWTKMKALYPFVGGNASSHKFNLKDPRDVDAAYRLVFNGGWTHTSTGALPNGTTGYADTKFSGTSLQQNFAHISVYSRTDSNGLFCDMGFDLDNGCVSIWSRYNNLFYTQINNALGNYLTSTNTNSLGLHISNRTSSTTLNAWKNNTKINTGTNVSTSPASRNIYLGALNDYGGSALYYSPRQQAFASIGDGLSDTEAANFYTAVQAYQTTLGRQV